MSSYFKLFKASGTITFVLAAFIARLPISMMGIGIITMISEIKGNYGLAASIAAVFTLSYAIITPQISRFVDRYGQSKVLPIAACISTLGITFLLFCVWLKAPSWMLFPFAFFSGCIPSISSMSRARWAEIYRGKAELRTAFSLEAVLDEMSYIIGPPIVIALSISLFPEAGPLFALILFIIGITALTLQKSTEPPINPNNNENNISIMKIKLIKILTILLFAMGITVGAIDVLSLAFAKYIGNPEAAAFILSAYAISSCLSGLIFGLIKFKIHINKLFLYSGIAASVTTIPLIFTWDINILIFFVLFLGIFFAPTIIISMTLVESTVHHSKLTEGFTWLITGLCVGISLGAMMTGYIVDQFGVKSGFYTCLIPAIIILAITLYGYKNLTESLNIIKNKI